MLIISFLLSTLVGAALALNLVPDRRFRSTVLWASPILGIGATALLYFLWTLVFHTTFAIYAYVALEILLVTGGLVTFWWRHRGKGTSDRDQQRRSDIALVSDQATSQPKFDVWTIVMMVFTLGCLAYFIYRFISYQMVDPYGDWDAWAIWNMRARYLFLAGEDWISAFSPYLHGSDYPVLISFYTARTWAIMGEINLAVPQFQALVFTLSSVGLVFDSLRKTRSLFQGLLAASILLLTPSFIRGGVSQYADIPLGAYILLTGILLFFFLYSDDKPNRVSNQSISTGDDPDPVKQPAGLAALAGMSAGFALWTKNEGLFLLAGVLLAQMLLVFFTQDRRAYLLAWTYFWISLLPALFLYTGFKLFVAPANYVFDQDRSSLISKVIDSARHKIITRELLNKSLSFGDWRVPLLPALMIYGVLTGLDRDHIRRARRGLVFLIVTLVSTLILYYAAYLVTTLPLEWQLKESLERLILQIYPLFLFTVFFILRDPTANRTGNSIRR